MRYSHTQRGDTILLPTLLVALLSLALGLALPGSRALLGMALFMGAVAACFGWLRVEVGQGRLELRFGVGLVRKAIDLGRVEEAEPVRNRWYNGWGIRLIPGGWLYNVGGLDAVELRLRGGGRYRIGTDEPAALTAALRAEMGR